MQALLLPVEQVFTEAADSLIAGRDALSFLMATLQDYRRGLDDIRGGRIEAAIDWMVARTLSASRRNAAEAQAVTAISAALTRARPRLDALARIVWMIECYASTARIVETDSTLQAGKGFSDEIRLLATRSRESYNGLLAKHEELKHRTLGLDQSQRAFGEEDLESLLAMGAGLAGKVKSSGADIRTLCANMDARQANVGKVWDRISQAISDLQIGDRFRQRLEHVVAFLSEDLERHPDEHTTSFLLQLAAAQLSATGLTLEDSLESLSRELETLSTVTSNMLDLARSMSQGEDLALASDMQALREDFSRGLALLEKSAAMRSHLDARIGDLMATVRAMETGIAELDEIRTQMRLASVNVLLRSVHSGDAGAAMQVVAKQFGELTSECARLQSEIVGELRDIETEAEALMSEESERSAPMDAIASELSELETIIQLSQALLASLRELLDEAPRARRLRSMRGGDDRATPLGAAPSRAGLESDGCRTRRRISRRYARPRRRAAKALHDGRGTRNPRQAPRRAGRNSGTGRAGSRGRDCCRRSGFRMVLTGQGFPAARRPQRPLSRAAARQALLVAHGRGERRGRSLPRRPRHRGRSLRHHGSADHGRGLDGPHDLQGRQQARDEAVASWTRRCRLGSA
ncbi:hypothetical protein CLG85_016520 [Yangia mangrovi]|uniref:Methyl-accepting transducer domain-containing protein n=1 Tax=Alloyangia mangrovi TaxID=1779329 RepID=A0A2A3JWW9_9RHOB|nr:hypothetical protein [Alloyangia mangrovi]MCT4371834.1 hypothetical protein [Alloyangia mangrovi]